MTQIAYLRVSTSDQNTDRQLAECGVKFDKTFTDKVSGSTTNRPALTQLQEYVRDGDTIHVHSIDRLARNLVDLQNLITDWKGRGVAVRFHKENLTFSAGVDASPMDELLLNMLGAVAQFERSMIKERQREGIAKAKKIDGKYQGGIGKALSQAKRDTVLSELGRGLSIRKTAEKLGIGVSSVQRIKKEADI
jgi:DNA invertase Pin-like site-specific DNA recombinase